MPGGFGADGMTRDDNDGADDLVGSLLGRGVMIEPEALDYARSNPHVIPKIPPALDLITLGDLKALSRLTSPGPAEKEERTTPRHGGPGPEELEKDDGHRILREYRENAESGGNCGDISEFLDYFNSRYKKHAAMLRNRPEMHDLVSVNRISRAREHEQVSIIGMVSSKRDTYSGHAMLEVEDTTGSVNVLVNKSSPNFKKAEEIIDDELVGVVGSTGRNIIFADDIIFPEVPNTPWPAGRGAAVFISDIHAGSKNFLEGEFSEFVSWMGTDAAKKVKYLFVAGDIIDGIGVYKGQQRDLSITDVVKQYEKFAELISGVPQRVKIFVCPGNHDVTREAEPQPPIPAEFASSIYAIPNIVMTSNPAWISVEGITVLMYHGAGLDSIIDSIPRLRKTGYTNPHLAMAYLLQKRHLVPSYGEKTRIYPDREDFMVIERLPNVFHSGHVHSVGIGNHHGVRVINSGTFQSQTSFQLKIGHHPTPAKVVYMDLQSGKAGVLDFSSSKQTAEGGGGAQ